MENQQDSMNVLFAPQNREPSQNKKRLEQYPVVKCAPGEEILLVQRRHRFSLICSIVIETLGIIVASFILLSLIPLKNFIPLSLYNFTTALYMILTILSVYVLFELYEFLVWYYQFYIITNKAIIHRYFFRINGEYSETVYGDKMHVQDVDRVSKNFFYDYLKIQDVYVQFHKLEREEPFIFKTPKNAQAIDDIIQSLVNQPSENKII